MCTTLINMRRICLWFILLIFIIVIILIGDFPKLNKFLIELNLKTNKYSFEQLDSILSNRQLFRTYNFLLETNRNFETSFECIGSSYNQSCLYKNLYYTDRTFWILTSKKIHFPLPDVRIGAFSMSPMSPNWRPYRSYEYLDEFIRKQANPIVIPNLTLYFNIPWTSNIGHSLFDGLYPAYLALIRFSPKHLQSFRILLSVYTEYTSSFSHEVYNRFAGLGIMNMSILEEISDGRWFAFQELVMGSGTLCQRCLQSNFQLPGGIELNGSQLFRDRMYQQYGLTLPSRRQNHLIQSNDGRQKSVKAYIIHNKRFTKQDKIEIYAAIDEINRYTHIQRNQTNLQWPLIDISYIDYARVTFYNNSLLHFNITQTETKKSLIKYPKMIDHLRILRDMNIYITGPGTGQMYQTFLADGSILINVGGLGTVKRNNTSKKYMCQAEIRFRQN